MHDIFAISAATLDDLKPELAALERLGIKLETRTNGAGAFYTLPANQPNTRYMVATAGPELKKGAIGGGFLSGWASTPEGSLRDTINKLKTTSKDNALVVITETSAAPVAGEYQLFHYDAQTRGLRPGGVIKSLGYKATEVALAEDSPVNDLQ